MRTSPDLFKIATQEVDKNLVATFHVDSYHSAIVLTLIQRHIQDPCVVDVEKRVMSTRFIISGPATQIRALVDTIASQITAIVGTDDAQL